MKSFDELGLSSKTLSILKQKGFEIPTPIQEDTIPAILQTKDDIVGQAQTGTGKTAAFGLPLLELLDEKTKNTQAIILTPTRELAIQVSEEIISLKGDRKLRVTPIYGGQSIDLQFRSLIKGIHIVVGTPGRVLDHLKRRTLALEHIKFLVLDEADEMLDMGFLDDVKEIMAATSEDKRTFLFSATMPKEILKVAEKYMKGYKFLKITKDTLTINNTEQIYLEVAPSDKFEALCRIIDIEDGFYGLVFCKTKLDVDNVATHLMERGYEADALHGDMSQGQREKILGRFKKRLVTIMVATDVAARGIDVHDLTHVINYALPYDTKSYVHRIGRTGRAGKDGIAITFITSSEYRKLRMIQQTTKTDIKQIKLPKVKDIIDSKKARIKADIGQILSAIPGHEFMEMSKDLLANNGPEDVIAALLQYSFKDVLNEKNYVEIEGSSIDKKNKTRLFVTQGKVDGLNPKKLILAIQELCKIPDHKIYDIQVMEKFSFVTLPFADAEKILLHFKQGRRGKKLYISKAQKENTNNNKFKKKKKWD